jgi:hypothetical protein
MAAPPHPQQHLWPALQRRFGDQNKPSIAPERQLRGLCCMPLDGQEDSSVWTLGFKEAGAALRTASLARDFQSLSSMIDPTAPCYLAVYVGDVPERPQAGPRANWLLVSYVPSTCTSFEARKMADNRAGLKAGLGAENFVEGGLWCVSAEQISLSNYMRSLEASGSGSPSLSPSRDPRSAAKQQQQWEKDAAAAKIQGIARRNSSSRVRPPEATPASAKATAVPSGGFAGAAAGLAGYGAGGEVEPLPDATEAIWEERIKGVRHAYHDSCSRLVSSLEELEQTLCSLTGDTYRPDEPILRARAHIAKNLELLS